MPLAFLALLEIALRLCSFGYPTSFLLKMRHDGKDYLVQNNRFGWRFFGRQMSRTPHPLFIPAHKPDKTIRVIVFGESAAFGDPQPAFGMPRMIEALLQLRHPSQRFEIVNAAMTGINSHAILPIARDCARAEANCWVIYMGNNEVVGPFGAGTVFGGQALPLPLVRAELALKTTRLGQALGSLMNRAQTEQEWGGMLMFIRQQVASDDPRLNRVYKSFETNLRDIVSTGHRAGAEVILCTMSSNLKDCPPLASGHAHGFTRTNDFNLLWEQALQARAHGETERELTLLRQASALGVASANVRFLLAHEDTGTNLSEALTNYVAARDLDTLRFRCDTRLNQIIREVAKKNENTRTALADVEKAVGKIEGIPGSNEFYDHVHFTFVGNYLAATQIVFQVEQRLSESFHLSVEPIWPAIEQCAERLGWSHFAERAALVEMLPRLTDPPFVNQIDHESHIARVRRSIQDLGKATTMEGRKQAMDKCVAARKKFPTDPELALQTAIMAEASRSTNEAVTASKIATELLPTSTEAWSHYAAALEKSGAIEQSMDAWRAVVKLAPDPYYAQYNLARLMETQGKQDAAIDEYRATVAGKPRFGPAWLSLGLALEKQGQKPEAEKCYQRALANRVRNGPELLRLANFCRERGWTQAAATNLAEAISLGAENPAALLRTGMDFAKAGNHQAAKQYFTTALQVDNASAPAHFLLGRELGLSGDLQAAEVEFREASQLMPDLAEARVNLAVTLAKQGRTADAVAEYESIITKWPTNEMARRNLETLRPQK